MGASDGGMAVKQSRWAYVFVTKSFQKESTLVMNGFTRTWVG